MMHTWCSRDLAQVATVLPVLPGPGIMPLTLVHCCPACRAFMCSENLRLRFSKCVLDEIQKVAPYDLLSGYHKLQHPLVLLVWNHVQH